jgi:hypothetical protein
MKETRTPLAIALVLLFILLALYVGVYFAMVLPGEYHRANVHDARGSRQFVNGYRFEGDSDSSFAKIAPTVFWPLEQIDRRLRPASWGG